MGAFTTIELIVRNQVYNLTAEYPHLGNDGLGLPPVRRLEEAGPLQDGATDLGFRLEPRRIKLALMLVADDMVDYFAKRRRLMQQFRPREGGSKLRFTLPDGSVRQIDTVYEGDLTLPSADKQGLLHKIAVSLRAPDPTFYDPVAQSVNFGVAITGGSFNVPATVPLGVGTSTLSKTVQLAYGGDWKVSPLITVYGPVANLKIENLTMGEKLDFAGFTLTAGVQMIIDTRYSVSTVVNGSGASLLANLTDDSDLTTFHLAPNPDALDGVNDIQVTGSGANSATSVFLSYFPRYLGI